MNAVLRILPILPLAACVATTSAAPVRSVADTVSVSVDGMAFTAARQPGIAGVELTAAGARSVAGDTILISRVPALAMHEGAVAKKAAAIRSVSSFGCCTSSAPASRAAVQARPSQKARPAISPIAAPPSARLAAVTAPARSSDGAASDSVTSDRPAAGTIATARGGVA